MHEWLVKTYACQRCSQTYELCNIFSVCIYTNVSEYVVGRNDGNGKLSVDACTCTCTQMLL